MSNLINQNINLIVSEPWEFGEGPFSAVIKRVSPCKTMIHVDIDHPIDYKDAKCKHFIGRLRQGGDFNDSNAIMNKDLNMIMVDIAGDDADWLKPNEWRGGVAIIATIKVA